MKTNEDTLSTEQLAELLSDTYVKASKKSRKENVEVEIKKAFLAGMATGLAVMDHAETIEEGQYLS